jgi:hypothetical protein
MPGKNHVPQRLKPSCGGCNKRFSYGDEIELAPPPETSLDCIHVIRQFALRPLRSVHVRWWWKSVAFAAAWIILER